MKRPLARALQLVLVVCLATGASECPHHVRLAPYYGTWVADAVLRTTNIPPTTYNCGNSVPSLGDIKIEFFGTPTDLPFVGGNRWAGVTHIYPESAGYASVTAIFWGIKESGGVNYFFDASWTTFIGSSIRIEPGYDPNAHASTRQVYRVTQSKDGCWAQWDYISLETLHCPAGPPGCTQYQTDTFIPASEFDQLDSCLWFSDTCKIVSPAQECDPDVGCYSICNDPPYDMLGTDLCCTCPLG